MCTRKCIRAVAHRVYFWLPSCSQQTHKWDILTLSLYGLLSVIPTLRPFHCLVWLLSLSLTSCLSIFFHTKHSGPIKCNYGCSCHNTCLPWVALRPGTRRGQGWSNCWHWLQLCIMGVICLGRDWWPTHTPQLALVNKHRFKHTRKLSVNHREVIHSKKKKAVESLRPWGRTWLKSWNIYPPFITMAGWACCSLKHKNTVSSNHFGS